MILLAALLSSLLLTLAPAETALIGTAGALSLAQDSAARGRDPHGVLAALLSALSDASSAAPGDRVRLLTAAADVLGRDLKLPLRAVQLREEAAELQGSLDAASPRAPSLLGALGTIKAAVALAQDLCDAGEYARALAEVTRAHAALKSASRGFAREDAEVAASAAALLLRQEASVLQCRGELLPALKTLVRASSTSPHGASASAALQQHISLLLRALAGGAELAPPLRALLTSQLRERTGALLQRGPWQHAQQLPGRFVSALTARPWHDSQLQWPHLLPVEAALREAAGELAAEFVTLR